MEKSLQQVFDHLSCKTLTRIQKGSVQLRELLQQTHFHSYFWTSKQSMDATVKKVLTAIVRNPSSEPMRKVNTELLTLLKAISRQHYNAWTTICYTPAAGKKLYPPVAGALFY